MPAVTKLAPSIKYTRQEAIHYEASGVVRGWPLSPQRSTVRAAEGSQMTVHFHTSYSRTNAVVA